MGTAGGARGGAGGTERAWRGVGTYEERLVGAEAHALVAGLEVVEDLPREQVQQRCLQVAAALERVPDLVRPRSRVPSE